ncbi:MULTISPECIES: 6-phosphogluconolactonase [Methylococcus]|uniref:6-phosphogluconolactonase n=1 Tax=Methylococcus capsulatus TaxID=414 RepID=A0ABZ2F6B4_METCP|nr:MULTISPECIES: 6-phosphogluconolactonase [Methylococcus]MDF9393039.1 6-phosphogluconolactonase [Methylococcus capsulatus]
MYPRQQKRWHIYPTATDFENRVVRGILRMAWEAIAIRGVFHIVLAGGKTPEPIYRRLAAAREEAEWRQWHVYWGDEFCLPTDDPGRNSAIARRVWLDHGPIPATQIHPIPAERGPQTGAEAYAEVIAGVEEFDLVLLGLGTDGHTAALFPGRDWGAGPASPDVLAVTDAPGPCAERVSLSAARLSRSREVIFLATGFGKFSAVQRWRCGEPLPAAAITPACGVDICVTLDAFDFA